MKGINVQETLLATGTALMGLGVVTAQTDVWKGLALVVVAVGVFFARGYMKK